MRLKEIRTKKGYTQEELSKKLKISRGTYSLWELERDFIPLKRLNDFCNICHVSIDYVLNFNNTHNYPHIKKEIDIIESARRLRMIRKKHHHTQEYIADKFKLDRSLISKYEKGKSLISTTFLIEYIKLYHISGDYLLGKIDTPLTIKSKELQPV